MRSGGAKEREPSSSRRSFPGARFPEERRRRPGISPARIPRTLMYCDVHRLCRARRRGIWTCALYRRARTEKETSALSPLCHHTWWPRCRLLGVCALRDAMRCDAMLSRLFSSTFNAFPGANTREGLASWPLCLHRACKDVTQRHTLPPPLSFTSSSLSSSSSPPSS